MIDASSGEMGIVVLSWDKVAGETGKAFIKASNSSTTDWSGLDFDLPVGAA